MRWSAKTGGIVTGSAVAAWAVLTLWWYGPQHLFDVTMPLAMAALWIAVFTAACYGAGSAAWRLIMGRSSTTRSDSLLTLGLGAGGLAGCAGFLGVLHLLNNEIVLLVLATAAAAGGVLASRRMRHYQWPRPRVSYAVLILAAGAIAALGACSLAAFYDQWNYHLAFPYQWLRHDSLITYPRHAYSLFPANMGLLYLYGLAAGGGWAAQLVHWWMGALTVGLVGTLAGRFARGSSAPAMAIFATTPGVIELGSVAGADLGVAGFALCAWQALFRIDDTSDTRRRSTVLAGVFVGLAVGSKYLAIPLIAVPLGLTLLLPWLHFGSGGLMRRISALAVVTAAALIVWSPWALRSTLETGDPVYPYLSQIGKAAGAADAPGFDVAAGIGEFGWNSQRLGFAATLGTFDHRDIGGRNGPLYLWLMPVWFFQVLLGSAGRRERGFAAALALGMLSASLVPSFGRYLIPLVAAGAVGCGAAFSRVQQRVARSWRAVLQTLLVLIMIGNLNPFPLNHLYRQIGVSIGMIEEAVFLSTYVSNYPAIDYINHELPADAVLYPIAESRSYGLQRELLLEDPVAKPLVVELAESSDSVEEITSRLRHMGVTHILVNELEARRMARYNDRQAYLSTSDPDAERRLRVFFETTLVPEWNDRHLTLWRLAGAQERSP